MTATPQTATVHLASPIVRGDQTISEVTLHKPKGGALRGLSVQALMQCDYNSVRTLVPRIATPQILETDFDAMDAEDVASFTGEVLGFFMSAAQKAAIMAHLGLTEADPAPSSA